MKKSNKTRRHGTKTTKIAPKRRTRSKKCSNLTFRRPPKNRDRLHQPLYLRSVKKTTTCFKVTSSTPRYNKILRIRSAIKIINNNNRLIIKRYWTMFLSLGLKPTLKLRWRPSKKFSKQKKRARPIAISNPPCYPNWVNCRSSSRASVEI